VTDDSFSDLNIDKMDENEEEAYVEYDITTYPSDLTISGLRSMKEDGDIIIPPYQRKFVWKIEQSSLLVESFLLGLPVPPLFFYVNDQNKFEVIDGQQRLMSMIYFVEQVFGEPDLKGRRQEFRLSGLSMKSPFLGKKFSDLEPKFQRKIENSVLRAINIRQLHPSSESTSVFHIFERLNTGGTSLKPQEIRNAVFRGPIVASLSQLNEDENWRKILGSKKVDRYQRDIELILRLFCLMGQWASYEKPMKEYLNIGMKNNKEFSSDKANLFVRRFALVSRFVHEALGRAAFRPKRVINAAVLEAVFVALIEMEELPETSSFIGAYERLMSDSEFEKVVRGATTDTSVLRDRIGRAKKALEHVVH
jgi:Protein of unknown function DUF262